ncbi:MAG TPA: hypothetical protein VLV81_10575 [Acidimicrobiia bacterium]|nr:hypothetical protein [Acidimicrobiia bacterium]
MTRTARGDPPEGTDRATSKASTQADTRYRNWAAALVNTPSDEWGSTPSVVESLAAAHAFDATATALKTQFVNQFNPLAAQFGLPTWSEADF